MICIYWAPHCTMSCTFLMQESVSFPLSAHHRYTSPTQVQNRSRARGHISKKNNFFSQFIKNIWKFISLLTNGGDVSGRATRLTRKTNKSLGGGLQQWHSKGGLLFTWPLASFLKQINLTQSAVCGHLGHPRLNRKCEKQTNNEVQEKLV